uniref:Uncharacterized protein n=1 Tax=Brassica oleracea var. oleracea TaxID=109376 RepID=A0A0D2ZXK5_BRAOL
MSSLMRFRPVYPLSVAYNIRSILYLARHYQTEPLTVSTLRKLRSWNGRSKISWTKATSARALVPVRSRSY